METHALSARLRAFWGRLSAPQRRLCALAAIMLLAVLARAPFFGWPLIPDEGVYAYTAHWWRQGHTLYSSELWMDRPQAIFWAYRLGMALLGGSTPALRFWGALWVAATAPLLYLIGRRHLSERAALLGALVYVLYSAAAQFEGFTANAEHFMLLPATAAVYLVQRRRPGWAGLLLGLAVMLKPSAVGTGLLALALLWRDGAPRRAYAALLGAAALAPLGSLAHGLYTVGWADYSFAVFGSRLYIDRAWPLGLALGQLLLVSPALAPLLAAGLLGQRYAPRQGVRLVTLWALTALPGMALGGGWYRHYFLQLVPPLALLAGASLDGLHVVAGAGPRLAGRRRAAWALLAALLLTTGQYLLVSPQRGAERLFKKPLVTQAGAVAAYLQAHTDPDDAIYVAYEGAHICHLAGRRSASPYLFELHVSHLPGVYEELLALLRDRRPAYVVTTLWRGPLSDPDERLTLTLNQNYDLVETIDLVEIYQRRTRDDPLGHP